MSTLLTGLVWIGGFLGGTDSVSALPPITLHINDRPPYTILGADGKISGLTADPAKAAFRKAGLPFRWANTPLKRQFAVVQSGAGLDCGVGLLKNPERDRLGKFSKPLYRDRAFVGLVRADLRLPHTVKMADLLANTGLRLLLKDGLTYGQQAHALITSMRPTAHVVVVETHLMLRMVAADRADWMLATEEEAGYLMGIAGLSPRQIDVVHFSDVQEGEFRYLYCSKKVPDSVMEQLNQGIPDL